MQNVESKGGGSKRVLGIRKVLSIAIAASFDPVRRFVMRHLVKGGVDGCTMDALVYSRVGPLCS